MEGSDSATTNHTKNSLKFEVESSLHFFFYGMGAQLTAGPACVQEETIQPCRLLGHKLLKKRQWSQPHLHVYKKRPVNLVGCFTTISLGKGNGQKGRLPHV